MLRKTLFNKKNVTTEITKARRDGEREREY